MGIVAQAQPSVQTQPTRYEFGVRAREELAAREWPSLDAALRCAIPLHDSLVPWAPRRIHLAAWLADKSDGELPADAPQWMRDSMQDLQVWLARQARAQAAERTEAEIEFREELAWLNSRERDAYLEDQALAAGGAA